MISAWENDHLLHRRRKLVKELALGAQTNDPIFSGAKHQRRRVNCARISKQSLRCIVKIE